MLQSAPEKQMNPMSCQGNQILQDWHVDSAESFQSSLLFTSQNDPVFLQWAENHSAPFKEHIFIFHPPGTLPRALGGHLESCRPAKYQSYRKWKGYRDPSSPKAGAPTLQDRKNRSFCLSQPAPPFWLQLCSGSNWVRYRADVMASQNMV